MYLADGATPMSRATQVQFPGWSQKLLCALHGVEVTFLSLKGLEEISTQKVGIFLDLYSVNLSIYNVPH